MSSTRRSFMVRLVGTGSVLAGVGGLAQAAPKVEEADPQASALGYRQDTSKVDNAKYPKHTTAQHCGTCQLFQGKAADASGGCPLFAGKEVVATGWCSAWTQKAG